MLMHRARPSGLVLSTRMIGRRSRRGRLLLWSRDRPFQRPSVWNLSPSPVVKLMVLCFKKLSGSHFSHRPIVSPLSGGRDQHLILRSPCFLALIMATQAATSVPHCTRGSLYSNIGSIPQSHCVAPAHKSCVSNNCGSIRRLRPHPSRTASVTWAATQQKICRTCKTMLR